MQINDTLIQKEDGWPFIIAHCLKFEIRPTLLVFERLDTAKVKDYKESDLDREPFYINEDQMAIFTSKEYLGESKAPKVEFETAEPYRESYGDAYNPEPEVNEESKGGYP